MELWLHWEAENTHVCPPTPLTLVLPSIKGTLLGAFSETRLWIWESHGKPSHCFWDSYILSPKLPDRNGNKAFSVIIAFLTACGVFSLFVETVPYTIPKSFNPSFPISCTHYFQVFFWPSQIPYGFSSFTVLKLIFFWPSSIEVPSFFIGLEEKFFILLKVLLNPL